MKIYFITDFVWKPKVFAQKYQIYQNSPNFRINICKNILHSKNVFSETLESLSNELRVYDFCFAYTHKQRKNFGNSLCILNLTAFAEK